MYSKNYDIYDALYTYAIITMLNTTLPLFLCSFSSNTTTIFRFFGAEHAIREMLAHCRVNDNIGIHNIKSHASIILYVEL